MIEKKPSIWVFDIDDTLCMNEWQYSAAFSEFYHYLYQNYTWKMPNFNSVYDTFKKIDSELFASYGVNRGRIAESMIQTYEKICEWMENRWHPGLKLFNTNNQVEKIRKIGDFPFDFTKMALLNNAELVLNELKSRDNKLCCLSSYDKKIFYSKARFLGLYRFFSVGNFRLTKGKKTMTDFMEASGWTTESDSQYNWYAVGNGPGDILPALEISKNWSGFYIPHGSTSILFKDDAKLNFFTPPPIDNPRVITLRDIKEILNHI